MAEELLRHPCEVFKEIRSERIPTFARVGSYEYGYLSRNGEPRIAEAAARNRAHDATRSPFVARIGRQVLWRVE